jgi:hypothetical protein
MAEKMPTMKTMLSILVCGIVTLWLAGCALVGAVAEPVAGQSVVTSDAAPETGQAATNTRLLKNEEHGYVLLYPEAYTVEHPNPDEIVLVVGSLLNVEQPRLHIEVQEAEGRTAAQVADGLVADVEAAMPGFNVERTTVTLDGEQAVVLDHMPGQDINRQLFVVHNDRLYRLTFAPADEAVGDTYTQMESLYATVINSFSFQSSVGSTETPTIEEASTPEPYLIWQGHTQIGEGDIESCKSLFIASDDQARVGPCGDTQSQRTLPANHSREFAEMLAQFAPFEYDTPQEYVVFRGKGQVAGPAWERALAAWARFTYGELLADRVSASVKTVMAWPMGEVPERPGYCNQVIVLVYGYAYVYLVPCQGGPVQEAVGGWLETDEWEQFDAWLYGRAPVYQDEGYFAGEGTAEMTEAEITELSNWAETVHSRLAN